MLNQNVQFILVISILFSLFPGCFTSDTASNICNSEFGVIIAKFNNCFTVVVSNNSPSLQPPNIPTVFYTKWDNTSYNFLASLSDRTARLNLLNLCASLIFLNPHYQFNIFFEK